MKVDKKKLIATLTTGMMLCSALAIPTAQGESVLTTTGIVQTVDASAVTVKKGGFSNGTAWASPYYLQNLYVSSYTSWGKTKYRSPKIKVCSFNAQGKKTSGKITVRITTPENKGWYKDIKFNSGQTKSIDYGYTKYNIQVRRTNTSGNNVENCYWWSVDLTNLS
jgi:hypothetical protein